MGTLEVRPPYTRQELAHLYPPDLELQQVQVLLRHGERTPVKARFQNAGLSPYWPYCAAANDMKSAILDADASWDTLRWTRRLEMFGQNDEPRIQAGPKGELNGICQLGELTDRGRETTLALGKRLRSLYVDQLAFLPAALDAQSVASVYLRATPMPRALESVQQAFNGLYPTASRSAAMPPPVIVTRAMQDEILFPNETACKRFKELARAFADRAAQLYNDGPELAYVNKKIGKYMPPSSPVVKVDSAPRLMGAMDTINASLAHGNATRLPSEFYDKKMLEYMDRISVEEWYGGYQESTEYRKLGIGALVGDLTQRMVECVAANSNGIRSEEPFKISLAGCHDTTIAASLSALGAFDINRDKWPKFTSSVAFELFKSTGGETSTPLITGSTGTLWPGKERTWWSTFFSHAIPPATISSRASLAELPEAHRQQLDNYYVRLRYNDVPVIVPFCKPHGRHFKDDESLCTLAAFKEAADSVTPKNWKKECEMNLGKPAITVTIERPPGL